METLRALTRIGPRPPCSDAERRAANYVSERMAEAGYEVDVQEFGSRPAYQPAFAAYLGLAAAGGMLAAPFPVGCILLGLTAFVLYARDAEGRPMLVAGNATSCNVVARQTGVPRLVVMAHMDTAQSSLNFHPKLVTGLRVSVVVLHVALAAVPVAGTLAWTGGPGDVASAAIIGATIASVYLASVAVVLVHSSMWMPAVAGANDNASGVEVLMRLASERPSGVWFVTTGSEESGMLGAQAFADRYRGEVSEARFLNVDSVGGGRVVAAYEEGILRVYQADRDLLFAAEEAGAVSAPFRLFPTDAVALMARRLPALTLVGLDDRQVIPNWHWPTDLVDNVDTATLDQATAIARHVLARVVAPGGVR